MELDCAAVVALDDDGDGLRWRDVVARAELLEDGCLRFAQLGIERLGDVRWVGAHGHSAAHGPILARRGQSLLWDRCQTALMNEDNKTNEPVNESWTPPELRDDEDVVGGDGDPVGEDNIREGKVRGTMHGGPTSSEGQGQGG